MKNIVFLFLLFISTVIPMSANAVDLPTTTVPQVSGPDLLGNWTLGFSGGTSMEPDGAQMALPYSEMAIEISSVTDNGGGVLIYNGKVAGYGNSSVSMIYQPARSANFIEMYIFIPVGMFPGAPTQDYFTMGNKLYITPSGNIMGIMAAEWNNAYPDNRVTIEVMYHSNVNMSRQATGGGKG